MAMKNAYLCALVMPRVDAKSVDVDHRGRHFHDVKACGGQKSEGASSTSVTVTTQLEGASVTLTIFRRGLEGPGGEIRRREARKEGASGRTVPTAGLRILG